MTGSRKIKISFLSAVFVCVAFCARAETDDLTTYKQALETCWQKWNAKTAQSSAELLSVSNQTEICMKKVGYSLIDHFYKKNQEEMKQDFDAFILVASQIEKDMYTKSDLEFMNDASVQEASAAGSSLHLIKRIIENMIACVSWNLKNT